MRPDIERRSMAEQIVDQLRLPDAFLAVGAEQQALWRIARLLPQLRDRPHRGGPGRQQALFQWGHLEVIEKLGEGSVGEVFRAYDPLLDRRVALKLCRPESYQAETSEWVAEARRLARIQHPNVLAVHGVDVHAGRAGIWLELVEGHSLEAWRYQQGSLAAGEVTAAGLDLARGLSAIHRGGLLHRDLKPANLLRHRDGQLRIADFGAAGEMGPWASARLRPTTPVTCAPEVLAGGSASVASDLYSVGCVLCWLVLGRFPFAHDQLERLQAAQQEGLSPTLKAELQSRIGDVFAELVERLLAPDPRRRLDSAHQVEQQLLRVAAAWDQHSGPAGNATISASLSATRALIGRDAALETLRQTLANAARGSSAVAVISGEPGAGKTALLDSFCGELELRGIRLLRVQLGDGSPSRLPPERLFGGDSDPASVESIVREQASASSAPLSAICIDDWHRADAAERDAWRALARSLQARALLWVVSVDEGQVQAIEQSERLAFPAHSRIVLKPLSREEAVQLVQQRLIPSAETAAVPVALAELLHELSGGNPFYLTELIERVRADRLLHPAASDELLAWRERLQQLSTALKVAAARRLGALTPTLRGYLEIASVLGSQFPRDALPALSAQAGAKPAEAELSAALDSLCRYGWLSPAMPGQLRFRHEVMRLAVYQSLDEQHCAALHRGYIEWLRPQQGVAAYSALSQHAERIGALDLALSSGIAAVCAADRESSATLAEYQRLETLRLRGGALDLGGQALLQLGLLARLRDSGRLREAQALARAETAQLPLPSGSVLDLRWRSEVARTAMALGHYREALAALQPALGATASEPSDSAPWRHRAGLIAVRAQIALGEYRQAEQALQQALADPQLATALRAEMQELLGWSLALHGQWRAADQALEQAWQSGGQGADLQRAGLLRRRHWVKLGRGRYQQAYALARQAHAMFRDAGDPVGCAKMTMSMGQTRLYQGLPEEAMGYLHRTLAQLEDLGDVHCEAEVHWLLGRALTESDHLSSAERHLHIALQLIGPIGDRDDEFRFLTDLARLRLRQQRPSDALQAAAQAASIAAELGNLEGQYFAQIEHADALLQQDAQSEAWALASTVADALRPSESGELWRADWLLARCASAIHPAAAAQALAAAQRQIHITVDELSSDDALRAQIVRHTRRAVLGFVAPLQSS